jgi:hypothetical protein
MEITVWVLHPGKNRLVFLCNAVGFQEALLSIWELSKSTANYEVQYFFSLGRKGKRFKLVDLLKSLGYEIASPLTPQTIRYYSIKYNNSVIICCGIFKAI